MSTELVSVMMRLGLTNTEAQLFLAATNLGGGTAKEISIAAGKERANAYHTLIRLQQMGIIETSLGSPTRFRPVETKEAIDHLYSLQATRLRELDEFRKRVTLSLTASGFREEAQAAETYSIIKGRISTYLRMVESIKQSKREVSLLLSAQGLTRLRRFRSFIDTVKARSEGGVRIRVISEITETNVQDAIAFSKICELRNKKNQQTNASIYDKRIGSVALTISEGLEEDVQEHVALWTNGPSFVKTLDSFFDSVWFVSVPAKTILASHSAGTNHI
jgi:sugar-specific transcriptional regulator TrmB